MTTHALAILVICLLAGCSDAPDGLLFGTAPKVPRDQVVEISEKDIQEHPALSQVLTHPPGFEVPVDYDEGLQLITMLQNRIPGYSWPSPIMVTIAYQGQILDLTIGRVQ